MSENDGLVGRSVNLHGMDLVGFYVRWQYHPFLCRSGEYVPTLSLASIKPVWVIERAAAQSKYVGEPFKIQEYRRAAGAAEIQGDPPAAFIRLMIVGARFFS